jgi:transposase
MKDASFFTNPQTPWQRRYEALRASFVDNLKATEIAKKYGYTPEYVRLLKHQFKHEKIDFTEPSTSKEQKRWSVSEEIRAKIYELRDQQLSSYEITNHLVNAGITISTKTVERVLKEGGYSKLKRRSQAEKILTVQNTEIPKKAEAITIDKINNYQFKSLGAGIFLFLPFLNQFDIHQIVHKAGLPGSKIIPAINYLLSFLSFKLLGTERYAHAGDHGFDRGCGLFAGLNVLPKCTAMSTYAYSLDEHHIYALQKAFIAQGVKLGLYNKNIINLDFHTIPHFGDDAVLEAHWAGSRNKTMKGALTLFAQDSNSRLLLYATSDILKAETNEQVLSFLSFWKGVDNGILPTLVFDSKFTTYEKLSKLNKEGIKFITLRRRGGQLIKNTHSITDWNTIKIENAKRKYPNPKVHEATIQLRDYDGEVRQIILKGTGRENPSFIITNDFESEIKTIVEEYTHRWRVENGISEAVKFFNLNALSSPILVKVHFDVTMTLIADTLYYMLAQHLRGFEKCDAFKIYRHFIRGYGNISIKDRMINIAFPKRAHNPILRGVPWNNLPCTLPTLPGATLKFTFM